LLCASIGQYLPGLIFGIFGPLVERRFSEVIAKTGVGSKFQKQRRHFPFI
jgi:hypothetical protein